MQSPQEAPGAVPADAPAELDTADTPEPSDTSAADASAADASAPGDFVTRGTDLGARIDGLQGSVEAARGRLDDALLDEVASVADRAAGRLKLSAQHTVVAIAGATGSGKSSTFNALTGLELSSTGVRRPTTSWATACVWGHEGAEELLGWLGIPPRHQTMRDSMLDSDHVDEALEGVVLLDLPDHDSTEVAHHLEVDRLVELADLLVWVLDPQKYADAAIHDRYLAPLRAHADVMVVVLNHIDTVPSDRRQSMVDDVRRLLADDGLSTVPVIAVSARFGQGVDELRAEVARRVAEKKLVRSRIEADLRDAALRIDATSGPGKSRTLPPERVRDLDAALADAAGVPGTVEAVERSVAARTRRATTWPPLAWLSAPDPLQRLDLDLGDDAAALTGRGRAVSGAAPAQRPRVDTALRGLGDDASAGLGQPWIASIRRAATGQAAEVGERLDRATATVDAAPGRLHATVQLLRVLQWLALAGLLVGLVWLALGAAGGTLSDHAVAGVPLAAVVLVVSVVVALLLTLLGRRVAAGVARQRAAEVEGRLRAAVHAVAEELVLRPVLAELAAHGTVKKGLGPALR